MPLKYQRRQFLRAISVCSVLSLAGCLSTRNGKSSDSTTTTAPAISEGEAKNRALEAEKQYLDETLNSQPCGDGSSETPIVENTATIENETSDGFSVNVEYGYSFNEDDGAHYDGRSEATYLVTENQTKRVSGTDISPC